MEIRFYCAHNGKKFYKVILHGEEIFCGTKGECQRFIKIHNEKVHRSLFETSNPRPEARQRTHVPPPRRLAASVVRLAPPSDLARLARGDGGVTLPGP